MSVSEWDGIKWEVRSGEVREVRGERVREVRMSVKLLSLLRKCEWWGGNVGEEDEE